MRGGNFVEEALVDHQCSKGVVDGQFGYVLDPGEPLHDDSRRWRGVGHVDHVGLQTQQHIGDGEGHRVDSGFAKDNLGDRFVLQTPNLALADVVDAADRLFGKEVDEADVGPAEEDEAVFFHSLVIKIVHLFQNVVHLVVAVEEKRHLQGENIGVDDSESLTGQASSLQLADAHFAQQHVVVSLDPPGIDLETDGPVGLSAHLLVDGSDGFNPAAGLGGQCRDFDEVLGRGGQNGRGVKPGKYRCAAYQNDPAMLNTVKPRKNHPFPREVGALAFGLRRSAG